MFQLLVLLFITTVLFSKKHFINLRSVPFISNAFYFVENSNIPNCAKTLRHIQKTISDKYRKITIKRFTIKSYVQSKVVDIHKSLKVENFANIHMENFFQGIGIANLS